METRIKTQGLAVGYDGIPLIKDIDLCIHKGEILTLIGANGAGKTTILKSIINQLMPLAGVVYIGKEAMANMKSNELAKSVAVVLTERIDPELMTVQELVAIGRYPYTGRIGVLSASDRRIIQQVMELVGIENLANSYFSKLSDGQKQRVLLAKALCQQPDIIVLDEPTSFLDIRYKLEFLSILQRLAREKEISVIMSLHEIDLAERVSDKIACVKGDKIDRYGSSEEIFSQDYVMELFGLTKGSYNSVMGSVELEGAAGEPTTLVIAGGGTGKNIFRKLQRKGIPFYAGIICESDLDYPIAKALAKEVISYKPFSNPTEDNILQLKKYVELCNHIYISVDIENAGDYSDIIKSINIPSEKIVSV